MPLGQDDIRELTRLKHLYAVKIGLECVVEVIKGNSFLFIYSLEI